MTLPYGIVDMAVITTFSVAPGLENAPCPPYRRPPGVPTPAQTAAQQAKNEACWRAPCTALATIADHQPPLVAAWVMGGCHNPAAFDAWAATPASVPRGHCLTHSRSQGGSMSRMYRTGETIKAVARAIAALA